MYQHPDFIRTSIRIHTQKVDLRTFYTCVLIHIPGYVYIYQVYFVKKRCYRAYLRRHNFSNGNLPVSTEVMYVHDIVSTAFNCPVIKKEITFGVMAGMQGLVSNGKVAY